MPLLTVSDLAPFVTLDPDKAGALIEDALARAAQVAPCITSDTFAYADAARAIIRAALVRHIESGGGAVVTESAGPFSMTTDTRTPRRGGIFWQSELDELAKLCLESRPVRAKSGWLC